MLFQKLLKPASAATGIQYVGGYTVSSTVVASNVTVSLTSLTGGIASSPSIGDLVVLYFGVSHNSTTPPTPTATGYTTIALLNSDDSHDARLLVAYKLLSAADTSITVNANSVAGNSLSVYVSVWRGIDATYPFDVAATTATGQNSVLANPPAITPITAGSYIIAGAEGAHAAGTQTYSSSDLTNFLSSGVSASSHDSTIGGGYNQWTSGSFDPAAFTFSATNNTAYSWSAATLALRPTGRTNPSFIASAGVFGGTVNVPSHNAGDWLILVSGSVSSSTPPSLVSGFTNIGIFANTGTGFLRSGRLQYIVSDGTITTISGGGALTNVAVLRNVTGIGATNFVNSNVTSGSTTISVSLTPRFPAAICLFGSYNGYSVTSASGVTLTTDFGGRSTTSANAASISGSLTYSFAIASCFFGAEFY